MSQTGCRCDRLLPYSRHEQAQEKKLLESIEVAKGLLKKTSLIMFSDSLSVMSAWALGGWNPKGKYMPVRLARDSDKA